MKRTLEESRMVESGELVGFLDCHNIMAIPNPQVGELEPEPTRHLHQLHQGLPTKAHKLEPFTGLVAQWQKVAKVATYKIPTEDRDDVAQDCLVQFVEHTPRSWAGCWAIAHGAIADYWRRQHPKASKDVSFDSVVSRGEDGEALTLGEVIPHAYNDILAAEARQILRGLPTEIREAAKLACQALPRGNPKGWGVQARKESILMARLAIATYARAEGIM